MTQETSQLKMYNCEDCRAQSFLISLQKISSFYYSCCLQLKHYRICKVPPVGQTQSLKKKDSRQTRSLVNRVDGDYQLFHKRQNNF